MKLYLLSGILLALLTSCTPNGNKSISYTLYRSSYLEPSDRIHIATFDADESDSYNSENCNIARDLFLGQPTVRVSYWCEKGFYKE